MNAGIYSLKYCPSHVFWKQVRRVGGGAGKSAVRLGRCGDMLAQEVIFAASARRNKKASGLDGL